MGRRTQENKEMKARFVLIGIAVIAILPISAQADMTVDIAKITCHRAFFIGKRVVSTHSIALWLSGYYSGRHRNTMVDLTTLEQKAKTIVGYCRAHRDETLAKAVQDAFRADH
jgi:acid stress chaperone HdeB